MTLHPDQTPLIVLGDTHVSLLPEDHPEYYLRRITVRRSTNGAFSVLRGTLTGGGLLALTTDGHHWHPAPETLYSTRNDDYDAWVREHRFDSLWHALNAASLVVGTIPGPGGMTTNQLVAFDDIKAYDDRGRDTSDALTAVRAILSRADTERDACHNYESYTSDPEAQEMRETLALVGFLLGRWRRTGRPARTKVGAVR
jgi:hypothetical protein